MSAVAKDNLINDIISTCNARMAVLVKEVTPSITHAVVAVVLYLLSNILSNDNVKYRTQEDMLAIYPQFEDRTPTEKQNLFLTANWMHVLFRIIPARKNKGIAMDIIPKFVEGNGAHYVTGGGQTQPTKDRVFIYETEGDCKPIKRLKRKSKAKLLEEELAASRGEGSDDQLRKKMMFSYQASLADRPDTIGSNHHYPLPAPFFHALPLPIPIITPRSQSSFSQAASVIANFGQVQQPDTFTFASLSKAEPPISYIVTPQNGLSYAKDEEVVPEVRKAVIPRLSAQPEVNVPIMKRAFSDLSTISSVSRASSTNSVFESFVENIEADDDPLAMLREVSADSDLGA